MRSLRPYALKGSMALVTLSRSLKGQSIRRWQGLQAGPGSRGDGTVNSPSQMTSSRRDRRAYNGCPVTTCS